MIAMNDFLVINAVGAFKYTGIRAEASRERKSGEKSDDEDEADEDVAPEDEYITDDENEVHTYQLVEVCAAVVGGHSLRKRMRLVLVNDADEE